MKSFQGIALIQSPLKFLRGGSKTRKGIKPRAPESVIEIAEKAAEAGQGSVVQRIARQYLRA